MHAKHADGGHAVARPEAQNGTEHLRVLRASACICVKCFLCRSATAADGMKLFLDNAAGCVLVPFMSAALKLPTPTTEPDPPRAGADMPRRLGRVLNLVRKLIDYGKQLAATVQQRAGTPGFAFLVRPFGTADIAVILARITCGLRRAAMLEAKLCKRAERGRDLTVPPIRLPAIRVPGAAREAAAAGRPTRRPARTPPRPPPHRGRDRRGSASPPGRRRHRRYLLRSRHRARPPRSGVLGRNQSRPHGVWRQLRPLLQRPGAAAMGLLRADSGHVAAYPA